MNKLLETHNVMDDNPKDTNKQPAVLKSQPKVIEATDSELLLAWEKLMVERFGFPEDAVRNATIISKTIWDCPGGGLDQTDVD